MIEIQMGLNRDVRRERLMGKIRQLCMDGHERIFLLVPEQSTYVMSREVCRSVGNSLSIGRVEVLGFKQLFEKVYAECGRYREHMDEGGRIMVMASAMLIWR